jgi:PAS domain S-box-containing protein
MPRTRSVVELEELRNRLREAEETLAAIRNGEVDSLIVTGPHGDQVFSLKGAEQPYRVFVEQMREGAITLTPEGTILYANRRFAEMVKSRLEKVIGAQIQSFVRAPDQADLAEILGAPDGRKTRYVLAAADDTLIPAQLTFSKLPIDDADAIAVVVTDLTEQEEKRELAEALAKLRAAQEQLQRQNEDLLRARSAAEAASDAKDHFLAALSHELRTPLTPVLMTVAALEADPSLDDRARGELRILRRNVEMEARLIDDLLDLTRIVRGKIEIKPEPVDVHALIDSALGICGSDINAKRLRVSLDLAAGEPRVDGDAVRIQQILWNLLRNAVKFTPQDGHIVIRTTNDSPAAAGDDAQRSCLRVTIVDDGMGIDPAAIGKIFLPFEQTDRRITRQFGGLGLGLAISKRLAELHDGTITAASEGRGKGATFTLTLPLSASRPGNTGLRSAAPAVTAPARPAAEVPRRLRILLVEDHEDTRRSMVRLLGRHHTVREAGNISAARAADDRAAQINEPFDLVISDLGLPDGSGLDLMRQLRDQYQLKGICLSGFGMEDDLARSADAGFSHHLTKPIDLRQLERVIETVTK